MTGAQEEEEKGTCDDMCRRGKAQRNIPLPNKQKHTKYLNRTFSQHDTKHQKQQQQQQQHDNNKEIKMNWHTDGGDR